MMKFEITSTLRCLYIDDEMTEERWNSMSEDERSDYIIHVRGDLEAITMEDDGVLDVECYSEDETYKDEL